MKDISLLAVPERNLFCCFSPEHVSLEDGVSKLEAKISFQNHLSGFCQSACYSRSAPTHQCFSESLHLWRFLLVLGWLLSNSRANKLEPVLPFLSVFLYCDWNKQSLSWLSTVIYKVKAFKKPIGTTCRRQKSHPSIHPWFSILYKLFEGQSAQQPDIK